jgi:hypothetical protein
MPVPVNSVDPHILVPGQLIGCLDDSLRNFQLAVGTRLLHTPAVIISVHERSFWVRLSYSVERL